MILSYQQTKVENCRVLYGNLSILITSGQIFRSLHLANEEVAHTHYVPAKWHFGEHFNHVVTLTASFIQELG